jgi:hypothetical protein
MIVLVIALRFRFVVFLGARCARTPFRVDYANVKTNLINQRTEALKKYLSEATNP